ncbi:MAG: tRNA (adenosine(37)-N6)-threonylcarbamoyltransferase complex transferase subunit TsaD [Nitrospinales bacterium]
MLVLGIETSCDETAAAVLRNGGDLLANVIASQDAIHAKYGGVVPELAGRSHVERIHVVVQQALTEARVRLPDIDLIAVTAGPGLVVSLLVGLNAAKAIAFSLKKPIIGINHLEGHLLSIFLQETVAFPYLALAVSGGHTDLYRVDDFGSYKTLGRTRDDAAGESFDKVAKMLNLGYPGGPLIEKAARSGNPGAHKFPRAFLENGSLDFSFSGLKTSVRRVLQTRREGGASGLSDADIAACFQEAVVDVLVAKLVAACKQETVRRAVVAGGVAANGRLRRQVETAAQENGIRVYFPKPVFCTDNAAMIACAGYHHYRQNKAHADDCFTLDAHPNLPLGK